MGENGVICNGYKLCGVAPGALGAEGGADVVGEDYHRDGGGGCNLGNGAQRDYR